MKVFTYCSYCANCEYYTFGPWLSSPIVEGVCRRELLLLWWFACMLVEWSVFVVGRLFTGRTVLVATEETMAEITECSRNIPKIKMHMLKWSNRWRTVEQTAQTIAWLSNGNRVSLSLHKRHWFPFFMQVWNIDSILHSSSYIYSETFLGVHHSQFWCAARSSRGFWALPVREHRWRRRWGPALNTCQNSRRSVASIEAGRKVELCSSRKYSLTG